MDIDRNRVHLALAGRRGDDRGGQHAPSSCLRLRSRRRRASRSPSTNSSNCLPVLNCITVGGLPATVRLIAAFRAFAAPATALSIQVPPALVNWSANTFTAAASPPEVHQWMTSAFISSAETGAEAQAMATIATDANNVRFIIPSRICLLQVCAIRLTALMGSLRLYMPHVIDYIITLAERRDFASPVMTPRSRTSIWPSEPE